MSKIMERRSFLGWALASLLGLACPGPRTEAGAVPVKPGTVRPGQVWETDLNGWMVRFLVRAPVPAIDLWWADFRWHCVVFSVGQYVRGRFRDIRELGRAPEWYEYAGKPVVGDYPEDWILRREYVGEYPEQKGRVCHESGLLF